MVRYNKGDLMKFHLAAFLIVNLVIIKLSASPVSEHGALRTKGSQIVGSHGNLVQLAGPSLYWSIWGGQEFYNKDVVKKAASDWNSSLIRTAINAYADSGYFNYPDTQLNYAKTVVDAAIENGIYVIVNWCIYNGLQHIAKTKEFFNEMAKTYKDTPNVIWEIWSEPTNESWREIKIYADSIIPVIRKYSSNLIVVGTPLWSSQPLSASENPLNDSNVAYSLNFWAGTHVDSARTSAEIAMQNGLAIFITQFGTTDAAYGQNDNILYLDETKEWLDWADLKGISWANWSLSNIDEPCSQLKPTAKNDGNWSEEDLSISGLWIRERLLQRPPIYNSDSEGIKPHYITKKSIAGLKPLNDRIYWSSSIKNPQVIITDLKGRIVQQKTISNPVLLNNIPKGTFLFIITNDLHKEVFKFVY